ncbi:transcriptional repressor [Klebsiella phage YMC16/01/N133_KPN_BP]|jgi:DNA-binding transcriptional regulator YdaS (Cro superfamily)|uniref:Uncharacterized protein n=1 Tax=Klebsiella phage YMC16/01/N133_KPN_BP TaxID=2026102 RepID=A0A248XD05_9CAUD|nr:transcriptional repressor [Klebsiella phage YMC16/01/N133_KPN_BP]ASW27688.1 hypothetical protein KPNN133_069 [Klebsiella phage YMC16/01/N133_KPN_BP]
MTIKPAGRYGDLGPLHDLLLQACPPDAKGKRSIMLLAKRLGVSYQNVYKWIEAGRVPPKRVKQIVELANGNILQSELLKFVI